MAGHRGLTVLLAVLGALLLGARAQQTQVIKVGSEVTMEPKYTGNPSEINWKIDGNKLVDMEVTPPNDPIFYRLQDRASIDRANGRLTIRGLTIGDSGLYRAEVLVNSVYQYTEITLTVRDCPAKPTITNRTTEVEIVLLCESSSPGVTYEWFNQTGSVGKTPSYTEPRSKKDVNLTCVVDNEVCKKSSYIVIRYSPESSGSSGALLAGILITLALIIIILVFLITMCCRNHKNPYVMRLTNWFQSVSPCLKGPCVVNCVRRVRKSMPFCKGNSTDVEGQPLLVELQVKMVGSEVTLEAQYVGNPSKITWRKDGNKLVDMELNTTDEPIFYHLQDRASIDSTNGRLTIKNLTLEDSGLYRAEMLGNDGHQNTEIRLTVRESCVCITVKFPEDQPKGKMNPCLTIHNVKPEDHEQYVLEVLQSDGEKHELDIKAQSQVKLVGSKVIMEPKYTGDPSEINWKIDGNKLVDLELNSPDDPIFYRLHGRVSIDRTNGRLTLRDLTLEDSGVYRAEVLLVNNIYQYTDVTLAVRETDDLVIIRTEDDRVTLTVPDTEKVTKITLKKGGVTLFQWKVSDLKLHTNNITLEPGFVTVKNADGRGSYKVEVHSANNRITNNTVQQEANNQGNESSTNREAEETVLLAGNGHPENQPIGSVTFHPINMTNKITWKKDGQPVNINGDGMISGPYGDLTINKVTSDDKGKYTVQCEDQKLGQEFILL